MGAITGLIPGGAAAAAATNVARTGVTVVVVDAVETAFAATLTGLYSVELGLAGGIISKEINSKPTEELKSNRHRGYFNSDEH